MNEEDFEVFLEDFCDFLTALEASVVKMKQQIAKLVGVVEAEKSKFNWNPDAIKWVEAEGFRGKYQRYPGAESKGESTSDYRLLLEDLKAHNGKLSREGFFYWLFEDGSTIGRKKRK